MKKIICIIFASVFYILGFIGLLIPVVPQVPFFVLGTLILALGSKKVKDKIRSSKFYNEHVKEYIEKYKTLRIIFEDGEK